MNTRSLGTVRFLVYVYKFYFVYLSIPQITLANSTATTIIKTHLLVPRKYIKKLESGKDLISHFLFARDVVL